LNLPHGKFDPDKMTDVQKAFWFGLTDQRIANIWEASDYIADLPQEAKDLLRNADKSALKWLERASPEDIAQLQYSIKVMEASKLLAKIFWFLIAGAVMTLLGVWEKVSSVFKKVGP
jgi:hypothetical protein